MRLGPKIQITLAFGVSFGLAIGLPLGWGLSQFHPSNEHQRASDSAQHAKATPDASGESNKPEAAPKQPEYHRDWWGPEAFLVYVTVPLMVFTGFLFKSTRDLARDARRSSASALKMAREEYIASHRPRMRVREFKMIGPGDGNAIRWTLSNVGGSNAVIRGVRAGIQYAVNNEDLPAPSYDRCQELTTMQRFAPGNLDEQVTLPLHLKGADAARWLYVFGYVAYADELGNGFLTAFIRKYDWPRGRFVAANDPDYEHED